MNTNGIKALSSLGGISYVRPAFLLIAFAFVAFAPQKSHRGREGAFRKSSEQNRIIQRIENKLTKAQRAHIAHSIKDDNQPQ
jgi:hypothetical protein